MIDHRVREESFTRVLADTLREISEAEPRLGLETRLLAGLRAWELRQKDRSRWMIPACAGAVALLILAIAGALTLKRQSGAGDIFPGVTVGVLGTPAQHAVIASGQESLLTAEGGRGRGGRRPTRTVALKPDRLHAVALSLDPLEIESLSPIPRLGGVE